RRVLAGSDDEYFLSDLGDLGVLAIRPSSYGASQLLNAPAPIHDRIISTCSWLNGGPPRGILLPHGAGSARLTLRNNTLIAGWPGVTRIPRPAQADPAVATLTR